MNLLLKQQRLPIFLLFTIFLIFLLHAVGLVQFHPGTGTHISANRQLLQQIFLQGNLPALVLSADFAVFFLVGFGLGFLLPLLTLIPASLATLAAMAIPSFYAFRSAQFGAAIPFEYSLLTTLVMYVVNLLLKYLAEMHSHQQLVEVFGQYVPPEIVKALNQSPRQFSMAGESRELSVFFCDIKDFTTFSEVLAPRDVAELLNIYFTEMTNILHHHGATIDKYIGDAIMAFWGAPLPQPDHARRATRAALDMHRALPALNARFEQRGWPPIEIGIGLNTGIMSVGNMGSRFRVAYTVIGDAVNLASRLEHLTRAYHVKTIVSDATRQAVPDVCFKQLDIVRVRGKNQLTAIYAPLLPTAELDAETARHLEIHDGGLEAYFARDWDRAQRGFERLLELQIDPSYYTTMLERIARFRQEAPPNWDGSISFGRHDD